MLNPDKRARVSSLLYKRSAPSSALMRRKGMDESKTSGIALVLECLQEVGIKCTPLGKGGIVAEGVDPIKALSVPAFRDIITESAELLSAPTVRQNSPTARRECHTNHQRKRWLAGAQKRMPIKYCRSGIPFRSSGT